MHAKRKHGAGKRPAFFVANFRGSDFSSKVFDNKKILNNTGEVSTSHHVLKKLLRDQKCPVSSNLTTMVYVSGPMMPSTYFPDVLSNIERLCEVSRDFFVLGYVPYCPKTAWFADLREYNAEYKKILRLCITVLKRCDAVYMLSGSRFSRGARAEHGRAAHGGIPVYYENAEDREFFARRATK